MTPYELVRSRYNFPFELYPSFQIPAVNELAPLPRSALWWEPGLGKTAGSTHCALYKLEMECDVVLCILPPILITLWQRWLARISRKDGSPLKVVDYRGSPARRAKLKLEGDFILMSIQIFKRDYDRIHSELFGRKVHVLVDEAHCLKDVGTSNYKTVRDFTMDTSLQLLTGTPLNNPMDAYAYIKFTAPSIYRNLNQFNQTHIYKVDFFNKPTEYRNLDLLSENLLVNADRKTKEDVLTDLPECTVVPMEYNLAPAHMTLYRRLVDEQLLKFDDGAKLDLTSAQSLMHALGQVIAQYSYFSQDETKVSATFELIDEVLEELGGKKLILFANYRRTNQEIAKRYNCPGVWGEVSPAEKQRALDRFIEDPECKVITMMPASGGVGVDGLQAVCSDILYVEPPVSVSQLTQSLSRVHREGQKQAVTVRLAVATGTIQEYVAQRLAEKEALVNPVQLSKAVLKDALLGKASKATESRQTEEV